VTEYFDLPTLIVDELAACFEREFTNPQHEILKRQVRTTDKAYTIGVVMDDWAPISGSELIGTREPGYASYNLRVQNLVRNTNEADGRRIFNVCCALMRRVLYRDSGLEVALLGKSQIVKGSVERLTRLNVVRQNFLAANISSTWSYLCETRISVESEMIRT
jgi:hypothetical protein